MDMINQQLVDIIKPKLEQGISEKSIYKELLTSGWVKKDIKETLKNIFENNKNELYARYAKAKKIERIEWRVVIIFVIVSILAIIFSFSLFGLGLFGAALGLISLLILGKGINYLILIIAILFLANIFRVFKIQSKVKTEIKSELLSSELYIKFKKFCVIFYIVNMIVAIIGVGLFIYGIKNDIQQSNKHKIEDQKAIEDRVNNEPARLKSILSSFKKQISSTQVSFVGYGAVPNNGDCINPAIGSLFYPNLPSPYNHINPAGPAFEPKSSIDPYWKNEDGVVVQINSASQDYVKDITINDNQNARCFSNQEHYAYQLPSYREDEFPIFYCVDDVHLDIQKSNKPIKGSDCTNLDTSYVPPAIRPLQDIPQINK